MRNKINEIAIKATTAIRFKAREFFTKENGDVNIVSIVVLIGIAVILALAFRKAISNVLNSMFNTINKNVNNAMKPM